MINIECAYLAGVIDSDGSIGIKRSTYAMRVVGDCTQPTYSEKVSIKQVEPEAIDLAYSLFGGCRFEQKPSCENGKYLHAWQVTDKKACAIIKAILPYLRIKKKQAMNCLELRKLKEKSKKHRVRKGRGHVGSATRSKEHSTAMQLCWRLALQLNGR